MSVSSIESMDLLIAVGDHRYCAGDCSELSDYSTPASHNRRLTANKPEQTRPDDPKFVARVKTLNLGVSRKRRSSRGHRLLPFFLFCIGLPFELSSTDYFVHHIC